MVTISHRCRVNDHTPEQSQGLDLSQYLMQDVLEVSASRPSKAVFNWGHQVRCRVFLEVFTFTVAGFRDSDSILYLPASLIPSQHYWQALCFCCIRHLCFGAYYRTPEDWMLMEQWTRRLLISGSKNEMVLFVVGLFCFGFFNHVPS